MNIHFLDLLVFAIGIGAVVIGYKRGFLRSVLSLCSVLVCVVLSAVLSPVCTNYIQDTFVYDSVYDAVLSKIDVFQGEEKQEITGLYGLNLPQNVIKKIQKEADTTGENICQAVATHVAQAAVRVVSALVVFALLRVLILLLRGLFGFIRELPFIGKFDKLLGALFGLLKGLVWIYAALAIVAASAAIAPDNTIVKTIKFSEFAKVMYNNNVILDFLVNDTGNV